MNKLKVDLEKNSYNIFIEKGLRHRFGELIKSVYSGTKIAIITDDNLNKIYGEFIIENLEKSGFNVKLISIRPGEKSKSFNILPDIYNSLLDFELTRSDLIVAFGGGVVGDLAGFVSSTFLRGVKLVQIPTSLLAQVDSSVGGKVAVDLKRGKNLIGSFYHPEMVLIDSDILDTLPIEFFDDGLGEVIKYGCIKSSSLFEKLENFKDKSELKDNIDEIIYECCRIKRDVVENDEKDLGERMLLNFGHTIGHAIEKIYNYETYSHGTAVSIGMKIITGISEDRKLTGTGTAKRIENLLDKYSINQDADVPDTKKLLDAVKLDKKNLNGDLNIILLRDIGESYIYKTDIDFFENIQKYLI